MVGVVLVSAEELDSASRQQRTTGVKSCRHVLDALNVDGAGEDGSSRGVLVSVLIPA